MKVRERPDPAQKILDSALAVIEGGGYSALSVRAVATAAGVSPAQVQYYFHTKRDLAVAAFERAGDLFLAELAPHLGSEPSLDQLYTAAELWLPLDAKREKRAKIWLAYSSAVVHDRSSAREAARLDAELRGWFTDRFALLQSRGLVATDIDAEQAGAQFLALIDGLTVHLLVLPFEEREPLARPAVAAFLTNLGIHRDH